jgi:hypothetical protein
MTQIVVDSGVVSFLFKNRPIDLRYNLEPRLLPRKPHEPIARSGQRSDGAANVPGLHTCDPDRSLLRPPKIR